MFKTVILSAFIHAFFNDLLSLAKGATAFGGHLTVDEVAAKKVTSIVNINDNYKYKITVERLPA